MQTISQALLIVLHAGVFFKDQACLRGALTVSGPCFNAVKYSAECVPKVSCCKRFHDVVQAGFFRPLMRFSLGKSSKDNLGHRKFLADTRGGSAAVHGSGHLHIHQDHLRPKFPSSEHRILAPGSVAHRLAAQYPELLLNVKIYNYLVFLTRVRRLFGFLCKILLPTKI